MRVYPSTSANTDIIVLALVLLYYTNTSTRNEKPKVHFGDSKVDLRQYKSPKINTKTLLTPFLTRTLTRAYAALCPACFHCRDAE